MTASNIMWRPLKSLHSISFRDEDGKARHLATGGYRSNGNLPLPLLGKEGNRGGGSNALSSATATSPCPSLVRRGIAQEGEAYRAATARAAALNSTCARMATARPSGRYLFPIVPEAAMRPAVAACMGAVQAKRAQNVPVTPA